MLLSINRMLSFYGVLGLMALALLVTGSGIAQTTQTSAVPFLLINPTARGDGMGDTGGGFAEDASAIYWNPAGLAFQRGQEASLTHSPWLPQLQQSDLFYDYAAGKMYLEDLGGTISGSITYMNLGENVITINDPTPLGTFKSYELALTAGYATQIFEDFGIGFNIRYIRDALANYNVQDQQRSGVANTVSFDLGLMWRPTDLELPFLGNIEDRFRIGLNLSNLGPNVYYIDKAQADPLPTNLRIGLGFRVLKSEYNNLNVAIDFNRLLIRRYAAIHDTTFDEDGEIVSTRDVEPYIDDLPKSLATTWDQNVWKNFTIGGGLEYWYGSPKFFAGRWGYFYENPINGGRKYMTYGLGIRYSIFGFDFSYLSTIEENHPLDGTLRFTLSVGSED